MCADFAIYIPLALYMHTLCLKSDMEVFDLIQVTLHPKYFKKIENNDPYINCGGYDDQEERPYSVHMDKKTDMNKLIQYLKDWLLSNSPQIRDLAKVCTHNFTSNQYFCIIFGREIHVETGGYCNSSLCTLHVNAITHICCYVGRSTVRALRITNAFDLNHD